MNQTHLVRDVTASIERQGGQLHGRAAAHSTPLITSGQPQVRQVGSHYGNSARASLGQVQGGTTLKSGGDLGWVRVSPNLLEDPPGRGSGGQIRRVVSPGASRSGKMPTIMRGAFVEPLLGMRPEPQTLLQQKRWLFLPHLKSSRSTCPDLRPLRRPSAQRYGRRETLSTRVAPPGGRVVRPTLDGTQPLIEIQRLSHRRARTDWERDSARHQSKKPAVDLRAGRR